MLREVLFCQGKVRKLVGSLKSDVCGYHATYISINVSVQTVIRLLRFFSGSQAVHEKAPFVKSVLIAGPRGVGKKMLVHCICTETGANMFDLTAANIAGKYPGKAGLQMMMHMVFKVCSGDHYLRLKLYNKHERSCLITFLIIEVFENVLKHCLECLIYRLY